MTSIRAVNKIFGTLLAASFLVALSHGADVAANPVRAYLIKAAFLYDMAKSTRWPQSASDEFDFCIFGSDPFGSAVELIDGRPIHNRVMDVRVVDDVSDVVSCDILFVGRSGASKVEELLAAIGGRSILTVSEMPDFIETGGMIQLKDFNNRLRFDMNAMAVRQAGLIVSIDALELADPLTVDTADSVLP